MSEHDDKAADDTRQDSGDELLKALAWTPKLAPFAGTERYRVLSCLGEGGFGVVYEVEDVELGRRLALKTLKPHRSGFSGNVQRLKREFRSVADLVHPNLVGLHELSTDGTRWFFTMDLVRGCHLLEYVRTGAAAREQRLRACLGQLVSGVSALHEAGIIHRDLKPSNVLVEPGGRVVILDFGLADGEQPDDRDLLIAGTPVYMAPEAADGVVGAAGDWYAVGVMLYEALAGRRPFDGQEAADQPAPLSAYPPAPADLERLCLALLRRDPRSRPGPAEIRALLGTDGAASALPRLARRDFFIGRAAELSALKSAYAAVERGEPTLMRLHGQPGVGKSKLLARFRHILAAEGRAVVLGGRCHERESVPFKAFDGVVDSLVRYLQELPRNQAAGHMPRDIHLVAQLFPVLEALPALRDVPRRHASAKDPRELRARAFTAVKELLARIADGRPLVIAIDDLQWGDTDSARLLAQLVTPPDRPTMLVVLAYRSDDAAENATLRETLATLAAAGAGGDEIALAPLAPRDAEELAVSLLHGLDPTRSAGEARAIAERGEGHPLFIAELVRAHLSAEASQETPPTLLDIIWQRVARLSAGARALLETVAVAGRPLASTLCFEAAGIGGGGVDIVRLLRAEQMLRTGDRGDINVFHDRVRDAVLLRADEGTRQSRHLALARALERVLEPDLEALARHFDAADEHEQAVHYAVRAADAAMQGLAFERAASLYQMAIDREGGSAELYEKLGLALRDANRSVAAGEAFLAAAGRVEGDRRRKTDLTRLAAEHMLVVGNAAAGLEVLRQALADVGEEIPRDKRQVIRLLIGHQVVARVRTTRFRRREEAALAVDELLRLDVLESACRGLEPTDPFLAMGLRARHYRRAIRVGEPRRAALAMVAASAPLLGYCRSLPPLVDRLLDAADAIGDELGDPEILARSLAVRGTSRFYFADWVGGAELSERAASLIAERCRGMASEQHHALLIAAMSHVRGGRFDRARRLGESLLLWAIEREDFVHRKQVCAAVLAPLRLAAGDVQGARHLMEKIDDDEVRCPSVVTRAESLAAIAQYCGQPRAAVDIWRAWWPRLDELGVMALMGLRMIVARSFGGALVMAGDDRRDQRRAASLERAIRRATRPASVASRALLCGQRAAREGRSELAAARLGEAADFFEVAGMPHDAAACRRRRGELVGGDEGAREVAAADQRLREMGIADPARWSATVAPPVAPPGGLLVE